jgi:hypothetical protein
MAKDWAWIVEALKASTRAARAQKAFVNGR